MIKAATGAVQKKDKHVGPIAKSDANYVEK